MRSRTSSPFSPTMLRKMTRRIPGYKQDDIQLLPSSTTKKVITLVYMWIWERLKALLWSHKLSKPKENTYTHTHMHTHTNITYYGGLNTLLTQALKFDLMGASKCMHTRCVAHVPVNCRLCESSTSSQQMRPVSEQQLLLPLETAFAGYGDEANVRSLLGVSTEQYGHYEISQHTRIREVTGNKATLTKIDGISSVLIERFSKMLRHTFNWLGRRHPTIGV